MGRSAEIFLRLSMIAGAFALLIFCIRAATAQEMTPPAGAQSEPYGMVPVENAQPDSQPYGIKPIPGYTPPVTPVSTPPDALRGSVNETSSDSTSDQQERPGFTPPPMPIANQAGEVPSAGYGYVPLRQAQPLSPPLRASTISDDPGEGYGVPVQAIGPAPIAYQPMPGSGGDGAVYRLGPGDKVRVTVFGESDLSGEYQIDGSGMVRLPLVGTLQASGVTAPSLEQNIAAALEEGYIKNPRVNVEITLYRPFYIIGAVNRPGQYPFVDHMSALNAVALAGGFTDQAVQSTVYVRHEGSATEEAVRTGQLTHIAPGDVVRVKTSAFWEVMNAFSPIAAPVAIAAATWH